MLETAATAIISAIFGGGMATWFLQRWIGKKLDAAERYRNRREEANSKEWLLVKNYRQRLGRFLFWLKLEIDAIMACLEECDEAEYKRTDGHLDKSWENFEASETELKNFENEQAASLHKD